LSAADPVTLYFDSLWRVLSRLSGATMQTL
jgi:hypothetical protein